MTEARNVVVFISGRGSNLRALLDSGVGGRISLVLSDNPCAAGLVHAGERGVSTVTIGSRAGEGFEDLALRHLKVHEPCLVALAGFMRILSGEFLSRLGGWVVNVHPSLLPELPGLRTHRRALAAGAKSHGCSVHWVEPEVDAGPVIAQERVEVLPGDDEGSLAARVLEAEHRLYPATVARILAGEIRPGEGAA